MSDFEDRARAEANRRWPDWTAPPADEDPEPDYSGIDAKWQNEESEAQRNAFVAGAKWAAEGSPPDGWFPFGSHLDFKGPMEASAELDDGGIPKWERHGETLHMPDSVVPVRLYGPGGPLIGTAVVNPSTSTVSVTLNEDVPPVEGSVSVHHDLTNGEVTEVVLLPSLRSPG